MSTGAHAPPHFVLGVEQSLSERRWIWRDDALAQAESNRGSLALAQRAGLPEIIARMLSARGVDVSTAATFLEPTLRACLPDPSCLRDMDRAAERLATAIRQHENIGIFGDYDVDGACSTAILSTLLRQLGCTVQTHIPDRMTEGYGPNAPALSALVDNGASLLVCVDCGTAAREILADVDGNPDIIVVDHHKAEGVLPAIVAVVNPNRLDCTSGLGSLCAAALVFLTCVALVRTLRKSGYFAHAPEPDLMGLLDLVALATVCDVMQLTGVNRAFVSQGLKVMRGRHRPGISALLEIAGVQGQPDAFTCGFALGPRINAGGRIAESDLGTRLLLSNDLSEAKQLAERLDAINRRRQTVESTILDNAMEMAQRQVDQGHAVLFLHGSDWHAGVVGIVAGRVKERFNRPALVGALTDGIIKGSGRSVSGLDLGGAIIAARQHDLLLTGGGHAMAAGFSLSSDQIDAFHAFVNERLASALDLPPANDLLVDGVISVAGATTDLAVKLGKLAPFGAGNEEPILAIPRVRVIRADRIGRDGNTLRVLLSSQESETRLKALIFRADDKKFTPLLEDKGAPPLHIAGWLRAESWNGRETVGFFIQDAARA